MANGVIICIGDELTSGRVTEKNARYAARRLWSKGFDIKAITTVGDDPTAIKYAMKNALAIADFVLVTGGLGATEDDITAEVAAKVFDLPLAQSQKMVKNLREFFEQRGKSLPDGVKRMAWLPKGALLLCKTSAGFTLQAPKGQPVFFLPGVPKEMRRITDEKVIPRLLETFIPKNARVSRDLTVFGMSEIEVQESLAGLVKDQETKIGYYPRFPLVVVTIATQDQESLKAEEKLKELVKKAKNRLNNHVVAEDSFTLPQTVAQKLTKQKLTLALAESCTGGLIGHSLTQISGSSSFLMRGYVVYSNKAKEELLDVKSETLDAYGAVSHQTAEEMALGAAKNAETDLGISVTGIAGPTGGSPHKPVGTVYFGLAYKGQVKSQGYLFHGGRSQVKLQAAYTAMDWLRRFAEDHAFLHSN